MKKLVWHNVEKSHFQHQIEDQDHPTIKSWFSCCTDLRCTSIRSHYGQYHLWSLLVECICQVADWVQVQDHPCNPEVQRIHEKIHHQFLQSKLLIFNTLQFSYKFSIIQYIRLSQTSAQSGHGPFQAVAASKLSLVSEKCM